MFNLSGFVQLLTLGGPIVGILVAMSVLALAIVLLKLWQFTSLRVRDRHFIEPALECWRAGKPGEAERILKDRRSPIADVMRVAIDGLRCDANTDLVREEISRVAARRLNDLRSYFRPLEVIGTLSPLLGLLGTVIGMINAFRALEAAGSQVNPAILSGGIWQALLTTAVGLVIAIPVVAALNWLERIVDRLQDDMQDALTRLFTGGAFSQTNPTSTRENTKADVVNAH